MGYTSSDRPTNLVSFSEFKERRLSAFSLVYKDKIDFLSLSITPSTRPTVGVAFGTSVEAVRTHRTYLGKWVREEAGTMSLQANWKRWTVVSIGVMGAIPACWLLWLMISTHGIHLVHLVRGDPPPGAEIIVPKPPLSGDDAFARLEAIALRLHKPASEPWLGGRLV